MHHVLVKGDGIGDVYTGFQRDPFRSVCGLNVCLMLQRYSRFRKDGFRNFSEKDSLLPNSKEKAAGENAESNRLRVG